MPGPRLRSGQPAVVGLIGLLAVAVSAASGALAAASLPGDCDGDGKVTSEEVQRSVGMLLGFEPAACGVDANADGRITADELQGVVNAWIATGGGSASGSATIGPGGGTLSLSGFRLTVPTGAFPAPAQLSVTRQSGSRGEGDLSDTFQVKGLPETFASDLALEITLDADPPALGPPKRLGFSFEALTVSKDLGVRAVPFHLPATASGRTVRATLPRSWGLPGAYAARDGRLALGTDEDYGVKVETLEDVQTTHFTSSARESLATRAATVLDSMETSFQKLTALGFTWTCRENADGSFRRIPVEHVALGTSEGAPLGRHNSRLDPCGTALTLTDFIEVTTDYPVTDTAVQAAAAHELFHLLQDTYTPRTLTAEVHYWLKEASSVWLETVAFPGSCPDVYKRARTFPWHGLFSPLLTARDVLDAAGTKPEPLHGYKAARFLEWAMEPQLANKGAGRIGALWTSLRGGATEMSAVETAFGALPGLWTAFATYFYEPKAVDLCDLGYTMYANPDADRKVRTEADLPKSFTFDAYPMSAVSYGLELITFSAPAKVPAPIRVSGLIGGQSVLVYEVAGRTTLATLTAASPRLEVPDIGAFKGSSLILLFVDANAPAANDRPSTNQVTLQVGETAPPGRIWNYIGVDIATLGHLSDGTGLPGIHCTTPQHGEETGVKVDWNGLRFKADYTLSWTDPDGEPGSDHASFTGRIAETETSRMLAELTATCETTRPRTRTTVTFELAGVPYQTSQPFSYEVFSMNGSGAGPMVPKLTYTYVDQTPGSERTLTLKDTSWAACDSSCYVNVVFRSLQKTLN